jgi:hypothetical protein
MVAGTTIRSVLVVAGIPPSGRRAELSWNHSWPLMPRRLWQPTSSASTRSSSSASTSLYMCTWRSAASAGQLYPRAKRGLDYPVGQEPQLATGGGWHQARCCGSRPDKKFARRADNVFKSEGARVILTPLMAPRANAHCRALERQRRARMPGLDADRLRAPLAGQVPNFKLGMVANLADGGDVGSHSPQAIATQCPRISTLEGHQRRIRSRRGAPTRKRCLTREPGVLMMVNSS